MGLVATAGFLQKRSLLVRAAGEGRVVQLLDLAEVSRLAHG
jgi:hypothetical protein